MSQQGHGILYMTSDVEEVSGKSFDYIVVGGGTSGCPLVATLSQRFSVLLVERGGSPYGDPLILEKKNFGFLMSQIDEFTSMIQKFVSDEGVINYRGRVLGGSTAINGGVYSRVREEFIERAGWDRKLAKDAYEWVESRVVFEPNELTPLQSLAKDAFVKAGITPFNGFSLEHVEGTKVTGTLFDGQGKRHCSADLLEAGDWRRITVLLHATVKNLIFHDQGDGCKPRARGIRFIKSNGNAEISYEAYLNEPNDSESWGDVVLSAGALGSPQILMLSGIGPKEHLKSFDISPLIDAAEVGKDIKDSPGILFELFSSETSQPVADPSQVIGITNDFRFLIQCGGSRVSSNRERRSLLAKVAYPASKGKVELKSIDPRQNPSVKFNYLVDERDLDELVEMVGVMKKFARSMDSVVGTRHNELIDRLISQNETGTRRESNEEELRQFCKTKMVSYSHVHGGCGIGAVVDEDHKVYGVEGLRVVDASTLSDSPGTSPMGTLLMLGRYQGIKILKERGKTL